MVVRVSARLHRVVERRHDHHSFVGAYAVVRRVDDEGTGELRVLRPADLTAAARRPRAVEESPGRHGSEGDSSTLARSKDHRVGVSVMVVKAVDDRPAIEAVGDRCIDRGTDGDTNERPGDGGRTSSVCKCKNSYRACAWAARLPRRVAQLERHGERGAVEAAGGLCVVVRRRRLDADRRRTICRQRHRGGQHSKGAIHELVGVDLVTRKRRARG